MDQSIHEIKDQFDAYAYKLGYCVVLFLIAGSRHSNPQFLIKLYKTGVLKMVDMNSLITYGDPSWGENLIPHMPQDWLTPEDLEKVSTKCEKY